MYDGCFGLRLPVEAMVDTLLMMVPEWRLGEIPWMGEMVVVERTMVMVVEDG